MINLKDLYNICKDERLSKKKYVDMDEVVKSPVIKQSSDTLQKVNSDPKKKVSKNKLK